MSFMQWTPAMSVGVPELDDDHKVLIRIINQLAENAEGQGRPAILRRCIYALMRYAEYHFGREEEVMRACGFPDIAEHHEEHRQFITKIQAVAKSFESEEPGTGTGASGATNGPSGEGLSEVSSDAKVNEELLGFLKDWLNHHILLIDMAYRPLVENRPEASKAAKAFKAADVWWSS